MILDDGILMVCLWFAFSLITPSARNNLVHQYGFDQLGERGRKEFAETIDAVVEELQEILEPNKSQQESNEDCIVM